jgi:predicted ATPase
VLARAYAQQGASVEAVATITEALVTARRTNETWTEAELHRIAGELKATAPRPEREEAESHFRKALAIARMQKARSYELRAAISYALLLIERDEAAQARDILAPVYGSFDEGFETRDLQTAKALLTEPTRPGDNVVHFKRRPA